jgi:enediyne biosynthesis protein E4
MITVVILRVALTLLVPAAWGQAPFQPVQNAVPFTLRNAATPEKHQVETMPGGIAVFDYDGDGKPDIFFVNGAPQPSLKKSGPEWWNRLYRNLGNWKFEDVTEKAGIKGEGYGMGAAVGDFDNDGWPDLLVTGIDTLILYRNRGDGTFEDVTARSGLKPTRWPISAGWFDFNNDGHLDLFVVNYCKWNPATEPFCGDRKAGYRTYCHPKYYTGLPNSLFRNNGDGTFTDVSEESGIAGHIGKGMAVAFADYNDDGLVDVFVTNDTTPNFLFRNEGNGKFREVALPAGVAIVDDGKELSSMGAEWRDFDGDGKPDIFITALANETFPLFRYLRDGLFQEVTYRAGLGSATLSYSGWSTGAFDFDLDGWRDIVTANGDVQDNTEVYSSRKSRQQNLYLKNRGDGTFAPFPFGVAAQHRGAAFGDFDGDGRVDVVMTRLNEPALLWRNTGGADRHWLGVRLRGTKSNRDALGAIVRVTAGGRTQVDHLSVAGGYLCSNERALWFGLGEAAKIERVEVKWPGGGVQVIENPPVDAYLTIEER